MPQAQGKVRPRLSMLQLSQAWMRARLPRRRLELHAGQATRSRVHRATPRSRKHEKPLPHADHTQIAQLESALFHANATAGNDPHPLLAPQYLDGGFASIDVKTEQAENGGREGSTSSSDLVSQRIPIESLLLSDDMVATQDGEEWVSPNNALYPPEDSSLTGHKTFDVNINRQAIADSLRKLLTYLPPKEEMRRRADRFFQQSGWYQQILRPDEYNRLYEPAVLAPTSANPLSPHKLAVVFMVMTLDIFFDTNTEEVDDVLVSKYWTATQQCFNTKHFGWTASVPGVQALALITMFVGFAWAGARESNFFWLRQLTTAIQQLGMHKEPHPSIAKDEANFRRRVFHECFIYDCLYSMNHGQRTAIPVENIEVKYPDNLDPLSQKKYDYMHHIMNHAIDIGARPDSLVTPPERLRELEEKMVAYDIVHLPYFHCPLMVGEKQMPERPCEETTIDVTSMTRTATSLVMYKSNCEYWLRARLIAVFMYRPTLRQLISRMRADPDSQLSDWDRRVILTSFDTCRFIVRSSCFFARSQPRLARRTWMTWVQVFSAVISIAALAIWTGRHMEPAFVNQAVMELHDGISMFAESGSERAVNLSRLIPMLQAMVVARYPFVLGPAAAQAPHINSAKEDMLFSLMGGTGVYKIISAADTGASEQQIPSPMSSTGRKASPSARPKKTSKANGKANQPAQSVSPVANMNVLPHGSQQPVPQWNPASLTQQHSMPQSSAAVQHSTPPGGFYMSQADISMQQPNPMFNGQMTVEQLQQLPLPQQSQYQQHMHQHQQQHPHQQHTSLQTQYPMQHPSQQAGHFPVFSAEPLPVSQVIPDLQLDDDLNPTELWARLQGFYEPTVWWGLGNGFEPSAVDAGVGAAMGDMATDSSEAVPAQQQQSGQHGQGVLLF